MKVMMDAAWLSPPDLLFFSLSWCRPSRTCPPLVKMSPTSLPTDSWMSDFESLLAPASTTSGSFSGLAVSMTTSGASGGTDGEYDGGAKRSRLFYFLLC